MNQSYYEELKARLLKNHTEDEVSEMIEYLQEAVEDSGLSEEEYLASLGTIGDVAALFEGKEVQSGPTENKAEAGKDFDGIAKLLISVPNGSVRVLRGTDPRIACTKGEEAVNIRHEQDKLIVSARPHPGRGFFRRKYPDIDLELVLPESVDLEKLEIHTVNTRTVLDRLCVHSTILDTVNGNVSAQECRFKSTRSSSVNGDLSFTGSDLGQISLDTVNGDLELKSCTVLEGKIDTVNGTVDLHINTDASIQAETVCAKISSDTDFVVDGIPGTRLKRSGTSPYHVLKISSVSGKIRFTH